MQMWLNNLKKKNKIFTKSLHKCEKICYNIKYDFIKRGGINMSGHSKWHNIQAKKGKADAARGKIFTVNTSYNVDAEVVISYHTLKKNKEN
mgnify:CR=1 FL=1